MAMGVAHAAAAAAARRWLNGIRTHASNPGEYSGAFGDVGTFIPLLLGLVVTCGLDFTAAVFFAGVFNIVTAFMFEVPMAVQPMKAIAAAAIAQSLPASQIYAAGILTSAVVGFLGITRLIDVVNWLVPESVVRGIQLGTGLSLAMKGIGYINNTNVWAEGSDNILMGIACLVLVLLLWERQTIPTALVLFVLGLGLAIYRNDRAIHFEFRFPGPVSLNSTDFQEGFTSMALPQIPLTTLNSVIAVCSLSNSLFPKTVAKPYQLALSVALMNLVVSWLGAMPMCHGASGLAAQYRFGARSNVAILFLGVVLCTAALALGNLPLVLFQSFPNSILGALLAVGGCELCLAARGGFAKKPSSARQQQPMVSSASSSENAETAENAENAFAIGEPESPAPAPPARVAVGQSDPPVFGDQHAFSVTIATAAGSLQISTFVGFLVGMSVHVLLYLGIHYRTVWSDLRQNVLPKVRLYFENLTGKQGTPTRAERGALLKSEDC
ncbi:sulfate transporter [Capsaspora owczarzaki ATCC 30864]|uniref:Sulfate transporter n=1 Tax=Capsaspora owczarzaki (strain ATCC 30864) TaxID=595528 RepID=A0A0D2VV61_CAPO3|nr:sulfate transporter [Capsaspora owczarzaki ATCC 30864]KJE95332.1 sulfate transporter [Capsaspora owczarzaki ATCC 30864]|eukprot:XP_004346462.2 sulfate transporter [Capsaspora owczarzaki ATCC 30864]